MINNEAVVSTTVAAPSTYSSNIVAQSLGLKNFFKTPEGRYKLRHDKCHLSSLLPYVLAKSITQVTISCPLRCLNSCMMLG
ncbi:hypothetical protein Hanom_Chr03g00236671 [Helianthus anomalus]